LGSHSCAERVVSEVTRNTDSSRVDHSILICGEVRALELSVVHVRDVLVRWRMVMILLNDLVKEGSKGVEALVAASVNTDPRVGPLASREDALLESEAILVLSVLAFLPDIARQHLGKERLCSAGEEWESCNLGGRRKVRSHKHAFGSWAAAIGQLA